MRVYIVKASKLRGKFITLKTLSAYDSKSAANKHEKELKQNGWRTNVEDLYIRTRQDLINFINSLDA